MHWKDLFIAMPLRQWLLRMFQGVLVGSGAILPGISGGVLCVLFGLYAPMMEFFAHPFRNFRRLFPQLFPAGVGWALGFLLFAKLLTLLFSADANVATWLFLGLIAGSFPGLCRQAGRRGRSPAGYTALAVSFAGLLTLFLVLRHGSGVQIAPTPWWFGFCGVLWGLSLVLPGVSASSTLLFLGLFEPMTAGIAALRPLVIVPIFLGAGLTVVLMARFISWIFRRFYCAAYHAILGFVLASTVVIVPVSYGGPAEVLLCLLCAAAGFAAAWWLSRWESPHGNA